MSYGARWRDRPAIGSSVRSSISKRGEVVALVIITAIIAYGSLYPVPQGGGGVRRRTRGDQHQRDKFHGEWNYTISNHHDALIPPQALSLVLVSGRNLYRWVASASQLKSLDFIRFDSEHRHAP
jgi:hypothetical protein